MIFSTFRPISTKINKKLQNRKRREYAQFETLESRTLLSSTLYVTPGTPDATHFQTLQAALAVAVNGDTVVLQPGFAAGSFISTHLTQPANTGATSIHTAVALDIGDVITIDTNANGDIAERNLVTAVAAGTDGFLITLASPLLLSHADSTVDAANALQGPTIGLSVGITLTAETGVTLPFHLEIWRTGDSASTTLSLLDMGDRTLFVDGNSSTISHSILGRVIVRSGAQGNDFLGNSFQVDNGDGLLLESADDTVLDGNTFNVTAPSASGIVVHNSTGVLILNNQIATGAAGIGIAISADGAEAATADIRGNTLVTTDGTGISIFKSDLTSTLQTRIQGNDLTQNAVGVILIGDGVSAGNIDLGGGATVFGPGTGGNNFSGFNISDETHFAIGLFATADAYTFPAQGNLWSTSAPESVVADATHTTAAQGTGHIATSVDQQDQLTTHAIGLSAVETGTSSGVVATFSSELAHVPADFTASIDWGDGTSSDGVIVANPDGTFSVQASHTWDDAGNFTYTVTIAGGPGVSVSASASATIAPRNLAVTGIDFTSVKNKTFTGTVATFTDNLAGLTAASYTATITWSDGKTTNGIIIKNKDGSFSVSTSRSFSKAGVTLASISLTTADGLFSGTADLTATITDKKCKLPLARFKHIIRLLRLLPRHHFVVMHSPCHR